MKEFPGPKALAVLEKAKKYYATTTQNSRVVVKSGEGAIVTDVDGNQFFDLHCDASVNNLGRNNSGIRTRIIEQSVTGNMFSEHHSAPNAKATDFAEILCEKSPVPKPAKVFFSNSGAEANEAARKLCRAYRLRKGEAYRKTNIYFFNGFAGRTKGVLAATSSKPEVQRDPFWDHCDQVNSLYLPYPREISFEQTLKRFENFMLEHVDSLLIELSCQGEGGIIPASAYAVSRIIEKAQAAGVICIVDAIQCGMGRDGSMFGCDHLAFGITPDILTMGKALGGGLPIGATIFRGDLDFEKKGQHSNTFGGGPMVMSSAIEAFFQIEKMLSLGFVGILENILSENLLEIYSRHPNIMAKKPRGRGAMWALEFVSAEIRDLVIQRSEEAVTIEGKGLRLLGAGDKSIRFMPPLNIAPEDLKRALGIFDRTLLRF